MRFKIYRALTYKPDYETMLGIYPTLANYNYKTDNCDYGYITITSLKQLMQLTKEIGREIILSPSNDSIEIYDDYRE